jgi:hypothetical protein
MLVWHACIRNATPVANNPNTPPETLALISQDENEDEEVREAAGSNPNAPEEI